MTFVANQVLTAAQLNSAFSAVSAGTISVDNPIYGVVTGTVSGAQRIANVTGINAAISAASPGGTVQFGPFTYQIDGTINMGSGICPYLIGVFKVTRIEQWHAAGGIDTIHYGPPVGTAATTAEGGGVIGFVIVSMVDQSTTTPLTGHLGAQLSISNGVGAEFGFIKIGEINQPVASHTHYAYNGICFDPATGPFNCWFHDIEIKGYGQAGANMQQTTSGNYVTNLIIRNGGLGEATLKQSNGFALIIGNGEGTFDQVNIEWSIFNASSAGAIYMPQPAGIEFGHLHMEGLQLAAGFAGVRGAFILLGGAGMARFESIHMISTNLPTGCNIVSAGLFGFGFSGNYSNINIGQLLISQTLTLGSGVNWYLVNTYAAVGAGDTTNCQVDFNGPLLFFGDGTFGSKLTGWSDCNFASTNRGPANGLGVPPTNLTNGSVYTITSASPGYSAGTYTQTNYDGINTYIYNQATNGTINMAQTIDPLLPVSTPMFPGVRRRIINATAANTLAVHNADTTNILTATNLATKQWVDIVFSDVTGKWVEVGAGTLL